jgi:hypothetical protein
MSTSRIAILGWGSLLWDKHPVFDSQHDRWKKAGPLLKLEFSRISRSRCNALTLVIDEDDGELNTVSYSISKRLKLIDAMCDLRCREGTTIQNIGYYSASNGSNRCRNPQALKSIITWCKKKQMTDVVWTDLKSNFTKKKGSLFVDAAITYIQTVLTAEGKSKAAEYIWRAPTFVNTPLRRALQTPPWFSP